MDRAAEDLDPSDHLLQVPHPGGAGGVLEELLQERGGGDVRDDQQAGTREERQVQEYHETLKCRTYGFFDQSEINISCFMRQKCRQYDHVM